MDKPLDRHRSQRSREEQTTVLDSAVQVIVPLDLIGLLAMISSIAAGLVGVIITLWLLHRVIRQK